MDFTEFFDSVKDISVIFKKKKQINFQSKNEHHLCKVKVNEVCNVGYVNSRCLTLDGLRTFRKSVGSPYEHVFT